MVYEHRDELPVSWSTWKGKRIPRYRRCHAGIVRNGLPLLKEENETEHSKKTDKNYKREFADSIFFYSSNKDQVAKIIEQ